MNARTGNTPDTLTEDKWSSDIPIITPVLSKRFNIDKHVNMAGRNMCKMCQHSQLFIINGRTIGDIQVKLHMHKPPAVVQLTMH